MSDKDFEQWRNKREYEEYLTLRRNKMKKIDNRPFYRRGIAGCVYTLTKWIIILLLAFLGALIILG